MSNSSTAVQSISPKASEEYRLSSVAPPAATDPLIIVGGEESDLPGDKAFALRISNLSMVDPTGPVTFPLNALIIVDPDRGVDDGDFVVIREAGAKEAYFRRLDFDGEKYLLHALNPLYPDRPLLDDATIVGVATHVQIPIVNRL
jgi:SOS-response transcriptional repressor LexA